MARLLRHRQTKGAETDRLILQPPRHIPTLPKLPVCLGCLPLPELRVFRTTLGHARKVWGLANSSHSAPLAETERWTYTTLREKLVRIGAKVNHQGRCITFQLAGLLAAKSAR